MFSFRNPAAWRRPFTEVYRDELDLIVAAEELGFDTIWLTEHHFADDGYSPSIIPLAAAIAARTERVRIGFNLLLLPLHNAIRVAEDIATLDVLSGGRIDVGLGQGYARHEFAGYGVDRSERLRRFVEGLDVLHGLWTEDTFSYHGDALRHRRCPTAAQAGAAPDTAPVDRGDQHAGRAPRRAARRQPARPEEPAAAAGLRARPAPKRATSSRTPRRCNCTGSTSPRPTTRPGSRPRPTSTTCSRSTPGGWRSPTIRATAIAPDRAARRRTADLATRALSTGVRHARHASPAHLNTSIGRVRTTHLALGTLPGMDPATTRAVTRTLHDRGRAAVALAVPPDQASSAQRRVATLSRSTRWSGGSRPSCTVTRRWRCISTPTLRALNCVDQSSTLGRRGGGRRRLRSSAMASSSSRNPGSGATPEPTVRMRSISANQVTSSSGRSPGGELEVDERRRLEPVAPRMTLAGRASPHSITSSARTGVDCAATSNASSMTGAT